MEEAVQTGWLKIMAPSNELLVRMLKRQLDDGEVEAITLAVERQAQVVLLDESDARRGCGAPKTGVIGLLIRAKAEGKISSLRQELDRLRQEAGFWISNDLYQKALEAVGEDGG